MATVCLNIKTGTAHTRTFVDGDVNTTDNTINIPDHGFSDGDVVRLTATDALPAGLTASHPYYVVSAAANTFKVAESAGGAAIDITAAAGGGTHTATKERTHIHDKLVKASGSPKEAAIALSNFFSDLASGHESGVVYAQSAPANPVAASGTITLIYADLIATDYLILGGVTLTCVTTDPTTEVQFKKVTDVATTATNLANCINRHSTLSEVVTASAALGVVTVTCKVRGVIGNHITWSEADGTATAIVLAPTGALAGGTGGPTSAAVSYTLGG